MDYSSFAFPLLMRTVSAIEVLGIALGGVLLAAYSIAAWDTSRKRRKATIG